MISRRKNMDIKKTKCKTALSSSSLPGLDYSLNPYKGCQHNCAYCYVPNVMKIDRKKWGNFIEVKTNIPRILSKEIRKKEKGLVGISTVTDPYQPIEKKYRLTRFCLEQLLIHDFPVCIQTKSQLVTRDEDIIKKFSNAEVMITIPTLNDNERKILEPNSSSIQQRLNTLKLFSDKKVKTSVFFGPIYPTIRKEDISSILNNFIKAGASEIMIDKFNLREDITKNMQQVLKTKTPSLFEEFSEKLFNEGSYYKEIRKRIHKLGSEKKIKIRDAF